jgi:hypothetical protein
MNHHECQHISTKTVLISFKGNDGSLCTIGFIDASSIDVADVRPIDISNVSIIGGQKTSKVKKNNIPSHASVSYKCRILFTLFNGKHFYFSPVV